jgi:aminopeptidase N
MESNMRQPVRSLGRAFVFVAIAVLAACAPRPAPAVPTASPAPAATAVVQAARVTPTASIAAPATAIPAATSAPTESPAPLFGPAWGDRSIYRSGLVASEHKTLDELPGASEYRIALTIDDSLTRVEGRQQVRYTNREKEPLEEVYFRLFPNALGGRMTVGDVTADGVGVTPEYRFERTAIRVPLPRPLAPGESVVIGLDYDIEVPESLDKGYGLLSYTDGILALDTPYAAIPVYDESGWNVETPPANADTSFNDASFYLAQVTAPKTVTVVATGVPLGDANDSNGGPDKTATYALGPARDFFVAASPTYTVKTKQAGETRINSYALPGQEATRDAALETAAAALESYSRQFGPYPYTELDVAATPMLALGIEYPGAVGISERVYKPGERIGGRDSAALVESTVAHEAAHQWFYNLVGSDQVDEPWLDEAVTQYATWLYFVDRYGKAAAEPWRDTWVSRWDRVEQEQRPVGLPAGEYQPGEYGAIVYGRGPLFLEALAQRMGQDTFDKFLGDYARKFRWGIATAADFKTMAAEACACRLDDLFKEWLEP